MQGSFFPFIHSSFRAKRFLSLLLLFSFTFSPVFAQEVPPADPVVTPEPTPTETPTDSPTPTDPLVIPPEETTPPVEPVTEPAPVADPDPAPVVDPVPVETPTEPAPTPEELVATEEETAPSTDLEADLLRYNNYRLYLKYEKRDYYKKYLRYRLLASKYDWEASKKTEKKILKSLKKDAKKYSKSPSRYSYLKTRAEDYASYASLKAEYFSLKPYAGYSSYILYDKDDYEAYKTHGTEENRLGYERYKQAITDGLVSLPEEDEEDLSVLGPEITVGIFNYVPGDLKTSSFSIRANVPFRVLDRDGKVKATIAADTKIRVKYLGDKNFNVYYSGTDVQITTLNREVRFSAAEEYKDQVVFDVSRPNSSFDRYRGSIRLRFYDSPEADMDRIWVINKLPLEYYVWGMGEITGTGPEEYNRLMTTIFRTYGFWKIKWSTKYAAQGFKVDATSGSQIYYGYDWEVAHDRIRSAAEVSRGNIVFYDGEVALTPYSSWTDGRTRRYEDGHWGHNCADYRKKTSSVYPWLSSVDDPYGKHPTLGKCELASRGNHMVGLSANGAVKMARDAGWDYQSILRHFYSGVTIKKEY